MKTTIDEFPRHPLPHVPPTPEPHGTRPQPPTVFVFEKQEWEYKVVTTNASDELVSEDELNALGKVGWELVGVLTLSGTVRFYLKRVRS
jgi:hypothetical protein